METPYDEELSAEYRGGTFFARCASSPGHWEFAWCDPSGEEWTATLMLRGQLLERGWRWCQDLVDRLEDVDLSTVVGRMRALCAGHRLRVTIAGLTGEIYIAAERIVASAKGKTEANDVWIHALNYGVDWKVVGTSEQL
jgi:hypothetical protein